MLEDTAAEFYQAKVRGALLGRGPWEDPPQTARLLLLFSPESAVLYVRSRDRGPMT
jgi:hypothetical protein